MPETETTILRQYNQAMQALYGHVRKEYLSLFIERVTKPRLLVRNPEIFALMQLSGSYPLQRLWMRCDQLLVDVIKDIQILEDKRHFLLYLFVTFVRLVFLDSMWISLTRVNSIVGDLSVSKASMRVQV